MHGLVLSNGNISYEYELLTRKKHKKGVQPIRVDSFHICSPRTNESYIVECEEYSNKVIVVKFFPKRLKNNKLKYNTLTGNGEASPIINTCIQIFVNEYYKKDDEYSFAFLGANTVSKEYIELRGNTKRWNVYAMKALKLLGRDKFYHIEHPGISVSIILNKKAKDKDEMIQDKIIEIFSQEYLEMVFY